MMDEITLKFPHLAEQIYGELDNLSLVKCKEVSLPWYHFLNNNKATNVRVIKGYTKCSDALVKKLAKNNEDVIQIVSDLRKIFENFRRGMRQSSWTWMSSPLHVAAESGYLNAYCLIMENITDKNPSRIFDYTKYSFIENLHKSNKTTPLHLAARNGYFNICESILENIKEKNPTDEDDVTPLHYAAQNGHLLICQMFMEKIKGQNPKTVNGCTPLHFAAANGHIKVCKLITESIEAPMTKDRWGRNPLALAIKFDHFHVQKYLEEVSGAKKQEHKDDNEKIEGVDLFLKFDKLRSDIIKNIHKEEEDSIVIYSEEDLYISDDSDDEQPAAKKLKTCHLH